MRESVDVKGRRYLTEGRLRVGSAVGLTIAATCLGDGAELYVLGYRAGRWWCNCAAKTKCSHLVALQLVTVRPLMPGAS